MTYLSVTIRPDRGDTARLLDCAEHDPTFTTLSLSLTSSESSVTVLLYGDTREDLAYLDSLAEAVDQARALIAQRTAVPPEQQALLTRKEVAA